MIISVELCKTKGKNEPDEQITALMFVKYKLNCCASVNSKMILYATYP